MKVTIHQPNYFPYPGFFHKLTLADIFVVLDDVQYQYDHTNRNKIITRDGNWTRIIIPTKREHKFSPINQVEIDNKLNWREANREKIFESYTDAPFFNLYRNYLDDLYKQKWDMLFEINFETIKKVLEWLGIKITLVRSSELNISDTATERLVKICKATGADAYVSGLGGKQYLNEKLFSDNKISLEYQNYATVTYPQHLSNKFVPNLSILDLLMNVGPKSLQLIKDSSN